MSDENPTVEIQGVKPPPDVVLSAAAAMVQMVLKDVAAKDLPSALSGFLGRIIAELPEEFWEEAIRLAPVPCGLEGCECVKRRVPLMAALDIVRRHFKEREKERESEGGFAV